MMFAGEGSTVPADEITRAAWAGRLDVSTPDPAVIVVAGRILDGVTELTVVPEVADESTLAAV